MKKETYVSPSVELILLDATVNTAALASANAEEGSAVLVSWLIG